MATSNELSTMSCPGPVRDSDGVVRISNGEVRISNGEVRISMRRVRISNRSVRISMRRVRISNRSVRISMRRVRISNGLVRISNRSVRILDAARHEGAGASAHEAASHQPHAAILALAAGDQRADETVTAAPQRPVAAQRFRPHRTDRSRVRTRACSTAKNRSTSRRSESNLTRRRGRRPRRHLQYRRRARRPRSLLPRGSLRRAIPNAAHTRAPRERWRGKWRDTTRDVEAYLALGRRARSRRANQEVPSTRSGRTRATT